MILTNNQLGRIQLILQEILRFQRMDKPSNDDALDCFDTIYDLFQTQELQQVCSDMKDVYNSGKNVELTKFN